MVAGSIKGPSFVAEAEPWWLDQNQAKGTEHLEVVGSGGQHVGTVDTLAIEPTEEGPAAHGQHHIIALDAVASVAGGKMVSSMPAAGRRGRAKPPAG